jgi:predicted amidohydrolase YtcJ
VILHNGPIYTMDPRLPQVAALAVAGERLVGGVDVREGDRDAVGHERVDLDGRCVLPGFTDSHAHFLSWALERTQLDLTGCASRGEALRAVAVHPPAGDWIRGHGWLADGWPDGPPSAAVLDEVTGERPAALWAHDHHTLWLNSAAMRATGASSATGVFGEWDAWRVELPHPPRAEAARALREAMQAAAAEGVVCVHDFERTRGRDLWQRFDADRRLRLRVAMSLPLEALDAATALELRGGFGSPMLRLGPCKAFLDGTLGSGTAWMLDGSGEQLLGKEELAEATVTAARLGIAMAVHAIGDRATRTALDVFERTRDTWEEAALRPRIEHAQCIDDADLPRFAHLGVIASMQPAMLHADRDVADRRWGERARCAYRVRDLLETGAHVIFGDDAPIEPLRPLRGIAAAVHRTLDERPGWHAEQAVAAADAVMCTTAAAAYALGEERRRGCLLPGYAADLVVLDTDIIRRPASIQSARVVATMVAGRWTHGAPPW